MRKDKENLEIAKKYLDSVREAKLNAIAIAYRVKELKTTSKKLIAVYQMESVGGNNKKMDISDYIVRIDEEVNKQLKAMQIYAKKEQEVKECIDNLEVEDKVKRVLSMRYLSFLKWADIASTCNYSLNHVYRLHVLGLNSVLIKIK
jgi:DNA-directed RNA polymerase specialized sigma subunit